MTTWNDFATTVVGSAGGGPIRPVRTTATAVDAATGAAVALRQDGAPVSELVSDSAGRLIFQAEDALAVAVTALGQTFIVESDQQKRAKGTFVGDLDDAVDDGIDRAETAGRLITAAAAAATFARVATVAPGSSIATALAAVAAAGGGIVRLARGTHTLTAQLTLSSNVTLDAEPGAVLNIAGVADGVPAIAASGTFAAAVALSANVAEGATTITVASAAGIAAGDLLKLSSTTSFGSTSTPKAEVVRVASVAGTTLTLEDPTCDAYTTAAGGQVEKLTPVSNVAVRGLTIVGSPTTTKSVIGIQLTGAVGVTLEGLRTSLCHTGAVYLIDCVGVAVTGCRFVDAKRAGFAYGVAVLWASQDVTITGCTGDKLRHLVTIGGGASRRGVARRIAVSGCTASSTDDAGFDCHPSGEFVSFIGCHSIGSAQDGIVMQGGRFTISGCTVEGAARYGILVQNLTVRGFDGLVADNVIHRCTRGVVLAPDATAAYLVWSGLAVNGNVISDCGYGIIHDNANAFDVEGLVFSGNVIRRVTASHSLYLRGALAPVVQGNSIFDPAATSEALYLNDCPDAVVAGNLVDGGATTGRALRLVACPSSSVTGNRLKNAGTGVLTDAACTGTVLTGNVINSTTRATLGAGTSETAEILADNGKRYRVLSAALQRINSTTWAPIDDAGHAPTGITSVTITATYIRVTYAFTATKVSSFQVTADDAFAGASLRVGASVGLTFADIYAYTTGSGSTPVDPGALSTAGGALWVTGLFEVA